MAAEKTQNLQDTFLNYVRKNKTPSEKKSIIAPDRALYLRDIAKTVRTYNEEATSVAERLKDYEALLITSKILNGNKDVEAKLSEVKATIPEDAFKDLQCFDETVEQYRNGTFSYFVRGKEIKVKTKYKSLSHNDISKVAFPTFHSIHEKYRFIKNANLPGHFPYSAGIFPFKRADEDPKRMFAGEEIGRAHV